MNSIVVPIQLLDKTLDMPAYAYVGDAGLDIRSSETCVLEPFERKTVSCGIALAIPQGYAGFILPRSGLASKHGISIVNAPGLIDSNYRGEIKVILVNLDSHDSFSIAHGDRIAQLVVMAVPPVLLESTEQLPDSERGAEGFGSSGLNSR